MPPGLGKEGGSGAGGGDLPAGQVIHLAIEVASVINRRGLAR